jgi:hypothetical protein
MRTVRSWNVWWFGLLVVEKRQLKTNLIECIISIKTYRQDGHLLLIDQIHIGTSLFTSILNAWKTRVAGCDWNTHLLGTDLTTTSANCKVVLIGDRVLCFTILRAILLA